MAWVTLITTNSAAHIPMYKVAAPWCKGAPEISRIESRERG
jgi:hypothetical protein